MLIETFCEKRGQTLIRSLCFIKRVSRDVSGVALIEFGYVLPIFLGFGLVGLELTNVVLARQKTERIAATVADLIASNQVAPNERQIGDIFSAVPRISKPFIFNENGNVIITAVIGLYDNNARKVVKKIAWQRCMYKNSQSSALGSQWKATNDIADGPNINFNNNIDLGQNQMVIVSEVFMPYRSLVSRSLVKSILPNNDVFTEVSTFRTRGGAIMNVTPVSGQAMHDC